MSAFIKYNLYEFNLIEEHERNMKKLILIQFDSQKKWNQKEIEFQVNFFFWTLGSKTLMNEKV